MACGCPVVVSRSASLPEVIGDAGLYVNPYEPEEISRAMLDVLTGKSLREGMIFKGLRRAKLFFWQKTAKQTLSVYEEILQSKVKK